MRAETIFLAFANSDTESLNTLKEEDESIYEMLSPLMIKGSILIHRDSKATTDSICHHLGQYRDSIRIFLYSGHAGRDKLLLEDQEADSTGIAHLLSQCPRLQLVFLNGCSTKGQVKELLNKGVPAVLATSAPIEDHKAKDFSEGFFTALKDQNTIRQSFELAKGELMTKYPGTEANIHGQLSSWGPEESDQILWGLYTQGDQKELEWKLPTGKVSVNTSKFKPNKLLFSSLVEALTPYSKEFKKIKADEDFGIQASEGQKFNLLMATLPHIISGQLSKVLAPPRAGADKSSNFSELGLNRLQQLVVIYKTIMELLGVTMLSQFWTLQFSDENVALKKKNCAEIHNYINLDAKSKRSYSFPNLIIAIYKLLNKNSVQFFIPELKTFIENLSNNPKITEATRFMEDLQTKVDSARIESSEAVNMCIPAEENLAELLKQIGFLANYMLASVKDISVLKYRHIAKPRYEHQMVKLIKDGASDPYQDSELSEALLDCKSVLIYKDTEEGRKFLNLSPFIIDQNAFDSEASINKLYIFATYNPSEGIISYKHVYKPTDPLLEIKDQGQYRMVKIQFDEFLNYLSQNT